MFLLKTLSKRMLFVAAILLLACLFSACGNEPESEATAVPEVAQATATDVSETSTPAPTETETAVPPTDTPTNTASPQPTDTPSPTATEEPTETPIPTDTPTASPSPVPSNTPAPAATAVPPTEVPPTAAPVSAHTFPETPIQPFDADTFIRYLGLVRDSFRSFNSELSIFEQNGKPGDCGTFIGWTRLWILEAPGFTDVPADWQPLYVEYRNMLRQIATITAEIRPLCSGEGGEVSAETTQALFDFFGWAYPRIEVMVAEANQIPR